MNVDNSNYFSREAEMEYFGTSQIKAFQKCEAKALATIKGEWQTPMTTALLVGSYVDAYFEGTLDEFLNEHPECFKRDGSLKVDYRMADDIIARIESDELFMEYMAGEKQVVKTGEIDGFKFKIKIDSYHEGDKIVDLKVMRTMDRVMGKSFVEYWNYFLQGAIYQQIEGNNLPFYLAVATKEEPSDIGIIALEQDDMDASLEEVRPNLARWFAIKQGEIEPEGCGKCDYCRATKKLTEPISSDLVGFSNKELKAMKGDY